MEHLVVITGTSGSGKTAVLKAFEDLDYLSIDNFPIRLLDSFLNEARESLGASKVAMVMDLRDKYFLREAPKMFGRLKEKEFPFDLLFLDARTEVIINRYNYTRRSHPLINEAGSLEEAINMERQRLEELREMATLFIDTSNFNIHQLREEIFKIFSPFTSGKKSLTVHLIAFGYKYGVPPESNFLFDVRHLPNPYFVKELKNLDGRDLRVKDYLLSFSKTKSFVEKLKELLREVVESYLKEDRLYAFVGVGCTGGRHRSPAIVDFLAEFLKTAYPEVEVIKTYRDIDKHVFS